MNTPLISLEKISVRPDVQRAVQIAVGDLAGNIRNFQDGLLDAPQPCLMAGLDYCTPWTRDAAFNTWFSAGLLFPEAAKNTLLSVLKKSGDVSPRIGGQYWDAIIWAQGAWQHYLFNQDIDFLRLAHEAVETSLQDFLRDEFDPADGLFRGGACFQDGVAGYPDFFAPPGIRFSGIPEWIENSGPLRHPSGGGVPCKALSTNCLYYRAFRILELMARELGLPAPDGWSRRADDLREAINAAFYDEAAGSYHYLVDAPGTDPRQEGLGWAFVLLFGIADDSQAERLFQNVHLTPHGMPCLWPTYPRYERLGEYGRHSGCIWPQVNAVWALACQARGRGDLAMKELDLLTAKACRDSEFIEVFHPVSGLPYGGMQEDASGGINRYPVVHRQSWCASGYLAMVLFCLLDIRMDDDHPLAAGTKDEINALFPQLR
ncbi:MAG: hypothetical protein WCH98_16095 [Verrucomicrobiota bacterium]